MKRRRHHAPEGVTTIAEASLSSPFTPRSDLLSSPAKTLAALSMILLCIGRQNLFKIEAGATGEKGSPVAVFPMYATLKIG